MQTDVIETRIIRKANFDSENRSDEPSTEIIHTVVATCSDPNFAAVCASALGDHSASAFYSIAATPSRVEGTTFYPAPEPVGPTDDSTGPDAGGGEPRYYSRAQLRAFAAGVVARFEELSSAAVPGSFIFNEAGLAWLAIAIADAPKHPLGMGARI